MGRFYPISSLSYADKLKNNSHNCNNVAVKIFGCSDSINNSILPITSKNTDVNIKAETTRDSNVKISVNNTVVNVLGNEVNTPNLVNLILNNAIDIDELTKLKDLLTLMKTSLKL